MIVFYLLVKNLIFVREKNNHSHERLENNYLGIAYAVVQPAGVRMGRERT